jgi:hypothetical protein
MKKKPETEKNTTSDVGLFTVEFESASIDTTETHWIKDEINALAFDGEAAIDKVKAEVTKTRNERFRLIGVRLVGRAQL